MSEFTVEIQGYGGSAGSASGSGVAFSPAYSIWQALAPAETVTAGSADEAARFTADNQDIAEGTNWRVVAWEGADADTATEPAATYDSI